MRVIFSDELIIEKCGNGAFQLGKMGGNGGSGGVLWWNYEKGYACMGWGWSLYVEREVFYEKMDEK